MTVYRDPMLHDINWRLHRLEQDKLRDVQIMTSMNSDVHHMKEGIDRISKGLNKLFWAVVTPLIGIIITALSFILASSPPPF